MSAKKKKRAFVNKEGHYVDEYTGPDGMKVVSYTPPWLVGEEPSSEERDSIFEEAKSGVGGISVHALGSDESLEQLEALLEGVGKGNANLVMSLMRFLDDPRVRPAIIESARKAPYQEFANHAQVLGLVGGDGAREILMEKMHELMEDPHTHQDEGIDFIQGVTLTSTAQALLQLDPDCLPAAEALEKLSKHPNQRCRERAIWAAADSHRDLQTQAMKKLEAILQEEVEHGDEKAFLRAALAMVRGQWSEVKRRAEEMLKHQDHSIRQQTIYFLRMVPGPSSFTSVKMLLDWLPKETVLRTSVSLANDLDGLVPENLISDIARRALADESPSLRLEAIDLLSNLQKELSKEIASEALADEVDPLLKRKLGRHA